MTFASLERKLFDLEIAGRAALSLARRRPHRGCVDLFLCVADHFEPQVGRPAPHGPRDRLQDWLRRYPAIARGRRDWNGRPATHTFFYPWDEYDEAEFALLAALCHGGEAGEIELHLHHRDDTAATLRGKLDAALAAYRRHGALSTWPDGRAAFGFIHGDWALANSRCEGGRNFCGVDNELSVLQQAGCYADFTFPAWRHTAQPRLTNALYYAEDGPRRPRPYDHGCPAAAGSTGTGLLLLQGPLAPYWRGCRPAVDDGDLAASRRYAPERLDRWVRAGIGVVGRPDRVFVKLHCHGAEDRNRAVLLGGDLAALYADAAARYNDGERFRVHFVTAREFYNAVRLTEHGHRGAEPDWRDGPLPPPRANAGHSRSGAAVLELATLGDGQDHR